MRRRSESCNTWNLFKQLCSITSSASYNFKHFCFSTIFNIMCLKCVWVSQELNVICIISYWKEILQLWLVWLGNRISSWDSGSHSCPCPAAAHWACDWLHDRPILIIHNSINLFGIQREAFSYSISDMCSDNKNQIRFSRKKLKPWINWHLGSWLALLVDQFQLDKPCMPSFSSAGHFLNVLGKMQINRLSPNSDWNSTSDP